MSTEAATQGEDVTPFDPRAAVLFIDKIKMELREEGIDCSYLGHQTIESPRGELESVIRILKQRHDRHKLEAMAEDFARVAARFLATLPASTK